MKRTALNPHLLSLVMLGAGSVIVVACGTSNTGDTGFVSQGTSNGGGTGSGSNGYTGASSGSKGTGSGSHTGSSSQPTSSENSVSPTGTGLATSHGSVSTSTSVGPTSGGTSSHATSSSSTMSTVHTSSSTTSSSSSSTVACTPPTSGSAGYATRYWDCCKPSCGSSHTCAADGTSRNDGQKDSCQGGPAYECYDMAPQVVSDSMAYAFAAYGGASCGTCFQLTFTGKSNDGTMDQGSQDICGKSIIVQVVNTGGLQSGQFDLLIPGGGVGANNACSTEWNASSSELGAQYGGVMLQCEQQDNYNYAQYTACTISACQTLFPNNMTMQQGCEFIVNWMKGANNPNVMYTQVNCPSALSNMSGI